MYPKSVREGIGADPAGLGDSSSDTCNPTGALPVTSHLIPFGAASEASVEFALDLRISSRW